MVAKVELLLEKYRVKKPEEMTPEELVAYENLQAKAQEAYENKIESIKKEIDKNEKYNNLSTGQRYQLAAQIYQKHFGLTFQSFLDQHTTLNNQPKLKGWAQFTFEEILQMESDGVNIPKEVLDWAHSMQDSDATDYVAEDIDSLSFDTDDSEMTKLQKKVIAMNKQAQEQEEEITEKETRLKELVSEAESIKRDQENGTKDALKQIQDLTDEWNNLSKKSKSGGLSESETARMRELGTLLNGEDGKLTVEVKTSNADMQDLMNLMDGLSVDIEKGIDIGEDTIQIAKELSSQESFYHPKMVNGGLINMNVNSVQGDILDAKGQNLSVNALEQGNKLVEFSNTLNNQIMMGQYQALYDFAKAFTTNSDETLQGTKEAMGDAFGKTSEEFESGEAVPEEAEDADTNQYDTSSLSAFGEKGQSNLDKIKLLKSESERVEEEALEEVEAYKAKQDQVGKEVQKVQEEKTQEAQTAAATGDTDTAQKSEEEAVSVGDDAANEANEAQSSTENITKEVEQTNKKELTIREKLKADIDLNNDYAKLNKEARTLMQMQLAMGTFASEMGTAGIVGGSILIANGTALLIPTFGASAWMIALGSELLVLGTEYLGLGIAMGITGGLGIEATTETGEQIVQTDETVNTALEEVNAIDGIEGEEDTRSQAEKEKDKMDKQGMSDLEQAAYFGAKSVQYSALTEGSIIDIKKAAAEAVIERILSDIASKQTVKATEKDNSRIEKLEERKIKAQQVKEQEEQRVKDMVTSLAEKAKDGDEFALEILRGIVENADGITAAIQKKVDAIFSAADQARIDQVKAKIVERGTETQDFTNESFKKVQTAQAELEPHEEESILAEDYGKMAVSTGAELLRMYGMVAWNPLAAIMFAAALVTGLFAVASGGISQAQGKRNLDEFEKTQEKMTSALTSITQDQSEVEAATGVAGISAAQGASEEGEQGAEGAETGEGAQDTEGEEGAEGPKRAQRRNNGGDGGDITDDSGITEGGDALVNPEEIVDGGDIIDDSGIAEGGEITDGEDIGVDGENLGIDVDDLALEGEDALVNPEEIVDGEVFEEMNIELPREMTLEEFMAMQLQETEEVIEAQEAEETDETEETEESSEAEESENKEGTLQQLTGGTKQGKEKEKEAKEQNKLAVASSKEANAANKESVRYGKEAEKDEKQLAAEEKIIKQEIEKEQKKLEKLAQDSAAALQEQLILGAEYEALAAATDAMGAKIQQKQDAAANAPAPKRTPGLLGGGGGQAPNIQQEIVIIMSNQGRMNEISSRFTQLDTRITNNRTAMIKGQATIKTRVKKFEKIAKEKVKLQKQKQKAEQAKQKELQKKMAIIGIVNNVFSIIGSIGSILGILADTGNGIATGLKAAGLAMIATGTAMLSNPFTAIAGAILVSTGTVLKVIGVVTLVAAEALQVVSKVLTIVSAVGILACATANAALTLAEGFNIGAIIQLGMAVVQAVMSIVGASGAMEGLTAAAGPAMNTAGAALQLTSSTLNIAATSVDMANNIKMAKGEEADQNLALASQIIGMTGALVGASGGFAGGGQGGGANGSGGFKSMSQAKQAGALLSFFGAATSTAGQISTAIKQRQGKQAGVLEAALSFAGGIMSSAGGISSGAQGKDGSVDKQALAGSILQGAGSIISGSASLSAATKKNKKSNKTETLLQSIGGVIGAAGTFIKAVPGSTKDAQGNKIEMDANQKTELSAAVLQLTGSVVSTAGAITKAFQSSEHHDGDYLMMAGNALSFAGQSVSTINGLAQGLKNGVDASGNSYWGSDAAGTILSLMGQAATISAQMSANIKQINGQKAGEVEEYLALAGAGLSTVGSATTTIGKAVHGDKKSPKQVEVEINDAVKSLPEDQKEETKEWLANLPPQERDEKLNKLKEVAAQERALAADPATFLEQHNNLEEEKAAKNPAYTPDKWENADDAKAKLAEQRKNILAHEATPKPDPASTPAPDSTPAPANTPATDPKPTNKKPKLTSEEKAKIKADKKEADAKAKAERKEERKEAREARKVARKERYEEIKQTFRVSHSMIQDSKEIRKAGKELNKLLKSGASDEQITKQTESIQKLGSDFGETYKDYMPQSNDQIVNARGQEYADQYSEKLKNGEMTPLDVIKEIKKDIQQDPNFAKQAINTNKPAKVAPTSPTSQTEKKNFIVLDDKALKEKTGGKSIYIEKTKETIDDMDAYIKQSIQDGKFTIGKPGEEDEKTKAIEEAVKQYATDINFNNTTPVTEEVEVAIKPPQGSDAQNQINTDPHGQQEEKKNANAKKQEQRAKIAKGMAIAKAAVQEAGNAAKVAFQIVETIEQNKQQDSHKQRQAAEINLAALERSRALVKKINRKHSAESRHSHYNRKA